MPCGLLVVELMLEHSSSVYTGLSAYRLKPEPFFDAKDFALNGSGCLLRGSGCLLSGCTGFGSKVDVVLVGE